MPKTVRDLVTSPMTPLSFQLQATVPSRIPHGSRDSHSLREYLFDAMTRQAASGRGSSQQCLKTLVAKARWTWEENVEPARRTNAGALPTGPLQTLWARSRCGLSFLPSPSSSSAVLWSCRWAANSRHGMRGTSWIVRDVVQQLSSCAHISPTLLSPITNCQNTPNLVVYEVADCLRLHFLFVAYRLEAYSATPLPYPAPRVSASDQKHLGVRRVLANHSQRCPHRAPFGPLEAISSTTV
ncbi:hypothetical protein DE146DRAFT_643980 [Phaeosphaeria sp. MPI-PUGE-AT-0046c]|nr:hypothetical protein DE146DRAFT_643980 [Phaeosphaeria sp. MPI-PUGE-AT-0046c]